MKRYLSFLSAFCATLFFVVLGCDDKMSYEVGSSDPVFGVQVVASDDSLLILPGDTVSVPFSIFVTFEDGRAVQGHRVVVSLADSQLGFVEFVNLDLRDRTDSLGRVECLYRAYSELGDQQIQACALGDCDHAFFAQSVIDTTPTLHIFAYHYHDYFDPCPGELDSVSIHVNLTRWNGGNLRGATVLFASNVRGSLQSDSLTDWSGNLHALLYFSEQYGEFWIAASFNNVSDTARFELREYDGPPETFTIRAPDYGEDNHVILPPNTFVDIAVTIILYHVPPHAGLPFQLHGGLGGIPMLGQTDSLGIAHFILPTGSGGYSGYLFGLGGGICTVIPDTLFYTVSP